MRCTVTATGGGGTLETAPKLFKSHNYAVVVGAGATAAGGFAVTSGAGGSGIVILRYTTSGNTITVGAGLTSSTTTSGADTIVQITAGSGVVSWA
jgi:hypothetical protein